MDNGNESIITVSKPLEKRSLLEKYDIPAENLSYEYIAKCNNIKELERIVLILRSGEEGVYPDLIKHAEQHLATLKPESMVLRVAQPLITSDMLGKSERQELDTDMNEWMKQMKLRERDLEDGKIMNLNESVAQPEIRQVLKKNLAPKTAEKHNRIKSCDYSAWDKFDADTEIDRIDLREEQRKAEAKRAQKERKERMKQVSAEAAIDKLILTGTEINVLAEQEKEKGNEAFRAGDYEEALQFYNSSLTIDSTINGYNNRAMTYIKLKRFKEALDDCNKVLALDYTNVKGLLRRATALEMLDERNKALADYELALKLEPTNKVAISGVKKLRAPCASKKVRMKIENESDEATSKEENRRNDKISSAMNRGRFDICFCDKAPCPSHYSRPLPHRKSIYCYDSPPKVVNKKLPKAPSILTRVEKSETSSGVIIEELKDDDEVVKPKVQIFLPTLNDKDDEVMKISEEEKSQNLEKGDDDDDDGKVPVTFERINSPYVFFCAWQSLKVDPHLKLHAQLLRSLSPENINTVIGNKMDGNMFSTILCCLEKYFCNTNDAILLQNFLIALSELDRFSIIRLFSNKTDKQVLDKIFEFLNKQNTPKLDILRQVYDVQ